MKYLKIFIVLLIFLFATYMRLSYFGQVGKDVYAYQQAVEDLIEGKNPYVWTVESYSNPDDPGNHGYAYLPGLLYINWLFFVIHLLTKIPFQYLWKIPVLLADLGVGFLLVKNLYKRSFAALCFGLILWFFNPYFYLKHNYVYTDPLPIFFMLLALDFLEKDDILAGSFYAISVALKTFPVLLFPLFLFKSKNKTKFLFSGFLIGIFISLPFMKSVSDFTTYLNGALFVHSARYIQGRPFLFYISYFCHVEFFQIIPFKVYTLLATFSGWILISLLYLLKLAKDKFILGTFSFLLFYLFTPVLNRTYLIWFLPLFIISVFNVTYKKYRVLYYLILSLYFGFYYWYLIQWKDGFHIWRPL